MTTTDELMDEIDDKIARLTEDLADMSANSDHFAEQLFLRTKECDELREALQRCPQYIVCAYRDGKAAGLGEDTLKHAQRDFDFVNKVLANTEPS